MTTIEQYMNDILSFTNSLVIKSTDIALAINKGLIKQGGINFISENKKEWKYFLNISGKKHYTNNDVMITVIEIGEKLSLSKELLDNYSYTKKELLKNEDFYKELINEYPDDELFIHGCMYPVDVDVAISAPDGTILAYNENYVEKQEYELIKELQTYIYNFLARWNVVEYSIVDELYIPSIYLVLYASLPNKIANIRNDKILTNQAHSFHLEHFFRSRLRLWSEISILNKQTIYWLYKNLDYLIINTGQEQILKTVINKILSSNLIGIGEFILRTPNNKLNTDLSSDAAVYIKPETLVSSNGLNSFYTNSDESSLDIETLVNNELKSLEDNNNNNNKNEFIVNDVKRTLSKNIIPEQKTKLLEITTYKLFRRNGIDLFKVIFDYLIYTYKNNTLTYLEEYVEPNTNKTYLCSPYIALLLLIKTVMYLTKTDINVKIKRVYYDTVLFVDKNCIDVAIKSLFPDGYINRLAKELKNNYPSIDRKCYSALEFKDLLEDITTFYNFLWTLDANTESGYVSSNLKMLCQLITDKGYLELSEKEDGETIDEILLRNNIVFELNDNFDVEDIFQSMLLTFTGITIDEYKYIKETSESFKTLLSKLTSYTVQVIPADAGDDSIYIKYNNTTMMRAFTGIITLQSGDFIPLEKPDEFRINAEASVFYDDPISIPGSNINITANINKLQAVTLNGYLEQCDDKEMYWISPDISAEITDYKPYPISRK